MARGKYESYRNNEEKLMNDLVADLCEVCAKPIKTEWHRKLYGGIHVCEDCVKKNLKKAKEHLDYEFYAFLEEALEETHVKTEYHEKVNPYENWREA